jgi:hypothetical protein
LAATPMVRPVSCLQGFPIKWNYNDLESITRKTNRCPPLGMESMML